MTTSATASSHEIEPTRLRDGESAPSSLLARPRAGEATSTTPPSTSAPGPRRQLLARPAMPVSPRREDEDPIAQLFADLEVDPDADDFVAPSRRPVSAAPASAVDGGSAAPAVRRAAEPSRQTLPADDPSVASSSSGAVTLKRGALVVSASARGELLTSLASAGYVVARCASTPAPGGLAAALDDAVEGALAMRGAVPASVHAESDPRAVARDQLFRTRALGAKGLCVVVPELGALATESEYANGPVLALGDAGALRLWCDLAVADPVIVVLHESDESVRVPTPLPLRMALGAFEPAPSEGEPEPCAPAADGESAEVPSDPDRRLAGRFSEPPTPAAMSARERPRADVPPERPSAPAAARRDVDDRPRGVLPRRRERTTSDSEAPAPPQARGHGATTAAERPVKARAVDFPLLGAATADAFAAELEAAHGPRPVAVVEQLFVERYAPLCETVNAGAGTEAARRAVARFRENFERSYTEGFTTMRLTGKRPRMVLDAPDLASRIGRLNGARAVHLLLVDSLRFDLGERCMQRLHAAMADRAACVERMLLWSALPTLTPVQLHLLGRGPAALREEEPPSERDYAVHRGRSAATLRRVRIGQRDLVKLDVVEARLRDAGPTFAERMAALSDEVAATIARHAESLAPRTLLFVFGDHGFRLQSEAGATPPASQGGASPEEVLVPAYAWLTGDVH